MTANVNVNAAQTRDIRAVYFVEPPVGVKGLPSGRIAIKPSITTGRITRVTWGTTSKWPAEVYAKNIKLDSKPYVITASTATSTSTTFSDEYIPEKIEIEIEVNRKRYTMTLTKLDLKKFKSIEEGRPPKIQSTEEPEATEEIQDFYLNFEPEF